MEVKFKDPDDREICTMSLDLDRIPPTGGVVLFPSNQGGIDHYRVACRSDYFKPGEEGAPPIQHVIRITLRSISVQDAQKFLTGEHGP